MNGNLLQITPHPTRKELGFVVIFVSCHSFFLSVEAFLRKVSYVMILVGCSSCNLEPPYHTPSMEMPCTWRVESDISSTWANTRWWEELGDPVLDALILQALTNNNDLKVAAARVCQFFAQYQVVASQLWPQIELQGTALKEKIPQKILFAPAGFNPITPFYAYAFTLAYELDFWGKLRSQAHSAYAEALASIEHRKTVVLSLVGTVAEAYVLLRQLDRQLEISKATLEERKEYLRLATLRFEGGLTSEIEVTQAAAVYEQTLADVTFLEELIPQQENLISILIGVNPTCILRGRTISEIQPPPHVPAGLPSELLLRRPDIRAAEDLLIAANAHIGAARAAFFPDISLTGLFGGESFQLSTLFSGTSRAWHIGTTFLQPLFTGGELTGELKVAWAKQQEALYAYKQTVLTAFQEVNDALIAYTQHKKLIKIQEDRVNDTKEYLHLSWLRYDNGQTDYLTVLDAERELFSSLIDLTRAQGETLTALINLYKALGGGWVIDADCCLRKQ
jgi:outer membrane protein, multidrug efflux system